MHNIGAKLLVAAASFVACLYSLNYFVDSHTPEVIVTGDPVIIDDAEIGYVPNKNARSFHKYDNGIQFHVYSNGRGARTNRDTPAVPKRADIVIIGCSFSWGFGIENEQTYGAVIEKQTGLTVQNLATGGYGAVQSLLMIRRNLDLKPKYVIYGWINDHLTRMLRPCAPNNIPICAAAAYVDFGKAGPYIHGPPYTDSIQKARDYYLSSNMLSALIQPMLAVKYRKPDLTPRSAQQRRAATKYILSELSKAAEEVGAKLIIVDLTTVNGATGHYSQPSDELRAAMPEGAELIDMRKHTGGIDPKSLRLRNDSHPSALAHQLIASVVRSLFM